MDSDPTVDQHQTMSAAPHDDTAARWSALGLYDPEDDEGGTTLAVLEFFESVGVDPNDFVGVDASVAMSEINVSLLAPGARVGRAEIQRRADLDDDAFERLCRWSGYDPDGTFAELDVEAFSSFSLAAAFFSDAELEPLIRVLRSLMSHAAEALTALFRIDVGVHLDRAGATPLEHAQKNWESAQLLPHAHTAMQAFLNHEIVAATRRSDRSRNASSSANASSVLLSVGFVDIVGYTPLADELEPDELGEFIIEFERRASDAVAAHGGRVVKLIGDEVMFVAVDPNDAFAIACDLIDRFEGEAATPRGGVVHGEMVARGGDYYGRVVNLASRIAAEAVAGEVLTDVASADAAETHEFEMAGRRALRGFAQPVELRSLRPRLA